MGISIKKLGQALLAQANPFDNGKTADTIINSQQPGYRQTQQVQRPQSNVYVSGPSAPVQIQGPRPTNFSQANKPSLGRGVSGLFNSAKDTLFDANTPLDKWKREQMGQSVDYLQQQKDLGNRAYTNPLQSAAYGMTKDAAKGVNTLAGATLKGFEGVGGLGNLGIDSVLGTDQSYQRNLNELGRRMDAPIAFSNKGGLMGQGTNFNAAAQLDDKKKFTSSMLKTGVDVGSIIPVGGGVAQGAGILTKQGARQVAGNALLNAGLSGTQSAATQVNDGRPINLKEIATSTALGGILPVGMYGAGSLIKGGAKAVSKANKTVDNAIDNITPINPKTAGLIKTPQLTKLDQQGSAKIPFSGDTPQVGKTPTRAQAYNKLFVAADEAPKTKTPNDLLAGGTDETLAAIDARNKLMAAKAGINVTPPKTKMTTTPSGLSENRPTVKANAQTGSINPIKAFQDIRDRMNEGAIDYTIKPATPENLYGKSTAQKIGDKINKAIGIDTQQGFAKIPGKGETPDINTKGIDAATQKVQPMLDELDKVKMMLNATDNEGAKASMANRAEILTKQINQVLSDAEAMYTPGKDGRSIAQLMNDTKIDPKNVTRQALAEKTGLSDEAIKDALSTGVTRQEIADIVNKRNWDNIESPDIFLKTEVANTISARNPKVTLKDAKKAQQVEDTIPEEQSLYNSAPDNIPTVDRKPIPVVNSSGQSATLGKIAETFFDNLKGDVKINYPMLDRLGKSITQAINDEYRAIGSDFSDIAKKVQAGVDNGIERLEDAGLTVQEANILRNAQAEMSYVRRRASLGKKDIGDGSLGEMYIPRQREGQYAGNNLFQGFRETKPGNEFSRSKNNGIKADEMDYDSSIIGEYVTRYGDTKLTQRERIVRAFEKDNAGVDKDTVDKAASDMIALQDEVNNLKTKIGLAGMGRKKTLSDGRHVDTAERMSTIGKDLGKEQITLDETPGGLTNGDRINSVEVSSGRTVGDYTGLNQHRDAKSFANSQFKDTGGDRKALSDAVRNRLSNDYDLPDETVGQIADSIGRIANDVPDEVVMGRVQGAYEIAAKQQMMKNLQTLNITNKTLRNDVSGLVNQTLRSGSIERQVSSKVVSSIMTTTNAIFRKFNLSSAINELSDLSAITTVYGKNSRLLPNFSLIKEFGLGDIDPNLEPYIKQIESGKSVKSVLRSINSVTNLYKFVETYKAGVMASSAKAHYSGLKGDALTKRVLKDYRDIVLPVDAFTKTFLDNYPLYTQYMSWGVRNLQKEGRLISGKLDTGIMKDKTIGARIARDLYANIPAKTAFWLTSNALKGTAILTAIGLTDFTGMTSQDYSGIEEEDKGLVDKATQFTNQSTILSLLGSIYQGIEKEQLKNSDKYKNADYNPYENNNIGRQAIRLVTPQAVKNVGTPELNGKKVSLKGGALELNQKGYSENAGGKVQYEAPTDLWNQSKSFVFGKNQTANAREYSGNKNIIDRVKEDGFKKAPVALRDMAKEQVGAKARDFNYPLNEKYTALYKGVKDKAGDTKAVIESFRNINKDKADFAKNEPGAKKIVDSINIFNKNKEYDTISPEKWSKLTSNNRDTETAIDELKKTAIKNNKDFGEPIDPIFDLPKDRQATIITLRGLKTGNDLEMKGTLKDEQWYKDFNNKQTAYFEAKASNPYEGGMKSSQRVIDYYKKSAENPATPANTAKLYPQIKEYYDMKDKNPDAAKQFFKDKDLSKQFDQLNSDKLAWTNDMRYFEGGQAISAKDWANVSFGFEDDEKKLANELYWKDKNAGGSGGYNKYGYGGGSGSDNANEGSLGSPYKYAISTDAQAAKVPVKAAGKLVKRGVTAKKIAKPQVSIKKNKV